MLGRPAIIVLTLTPLLAVAAPVPVDDARAQLERAYGTWDDPEKDCKFKITGGELRIMLPAAERFLLPIFDGKNNTAPRALREVDGDFTATVRVTFAVPEQVPPGRERSYGGGLLAWVDDQHHVATRRSGGMVNGLREAIFTHRRTPDSTGLNYRGCGEPGTSAFVRLTRAGNEVFSGWSRDGKEWHDSRPITVDWVPKCKVGVFAENTLLKPAEITFDQYSLSQPKK